MIIGVVGLGLIGGSMAKAVSSRTGFKVMGVDLDKGVMEAATADGTIIAELTSAVVPLCDMIIIALTPLATIKWISDNGEQIAKDTIVVDCCGTKRNVCKTCKEVAQKYGFSFVGGHPMAGTERTGYEASRANLFDRASMILVEAEGHFDMLEEFFLSVGFGKVVTSSAEGHDAVIAYTSQLAHVVSSAYMASPAAELHEGFSAGSFKDLTRVAYLNEPLWAELFMQNRDFLSLEIDRIVERLSHFKRALKAPDNDMLTSLLTEGKMRKIAYGGGVE